jgi:hypothetical protein
MSHLSESDLKSMPKKPLNAYFKYRMERMEAHAGEDYPGKLAQQDWDSLDEEQKKALEDSYKA